MDQYLHFNSNHPLEHKRGVAKNLIPRVETAVSDERDKSQKEKSHVKQALNMDAYPDTARDTTTK